MSPLGLLRPAMKSQGYLSALHECGFLKTLLAAVSSGFHSPIHTSAKLKRVHAQPAVAGWANSLGIDPQIFRTGPVPPLQGFFQWTHVTWSAQASAESMWMTARPSETSCGTNAWTWGSCRPMRLRCSAARSTRAATGRPTAS